MAIDAVPEARSYIVNRNGKGKSNGKGLVWRKLKRQNTNWVERIHFNLSDRFAGSGGRLCGALRGFKENVRSREKNHALVDFPSVGDSWQAKQSGGGKASSCGCQRCMKVVDPIDPYP